MFTDSSRGLNVRKINGHPVLHMNDNPFFYFGGEIEYYRIPKDEWKARLSRAKECGLTVVTTYVPWNWHEYEEGRFDFAGETNPSRDLEGFLRTCEELGLYVVPRPGPWICNEWKFGGYPEWFLRDHWPASASLDSTGIPQTGEFKTGNWVTDSYPALCYIDSDFREHVEKWYGAVCKVLKGHLSRFGGCVIALAVDNETSFTFNQGAFDSDYNPEVVKLYRDTCGVSPPRGWPSPIPQNRERLAEVFRWLRFKDSYLADYLSWLGDLLRSNGVDGVPLVSNDAVRRFRYFPPINVHEKNERGIWIWGDYYPMVAVAGRVAFFQLTPLTLIQWPLFGTEVLRAAQQSLPPMSMEFQGGWSTRPPFVKPGDTRLLSYYAMAHGLKGLNYFMFADGTNPEGFELTWHTGRSYDFSAALNENGEPTERYFALERIGRFLKENGGRLAGCSKLSDVALAYYLPYFHAPPRSRGYGLRCDVRQLMEGEFFGLMRLMNLSGISYELLDIEHADLEKMLEHKAILLLSFDYMNSSTQRKLVDYVKGGGSLIAHPCVPWLDENLNRCDLMNELFPATISDTIEEDMQPLTVGDMPAVAMQGTDEFNLDGLDAQPLALSSRNAVCGYMVKHGKGLGILLGATISSWSTNPEVAEKMTEAQKEAMRGAILYLVEQAGVRRHAFSSDPDAELVEQVANDGSYGFVFATNLQGDARKVWLHVTDPESHKEIVMPRKSELTIPAKTPYALSLNVPTPDSDVRILYSTSEIHGIRTEGSSVVIDTWAEMMGEGEMALKMDEKPNSVTIDGEQANFTWDNKDKTLYLVYEQGEHTIKIQPSLERIRHNCMNKNRDGSFSIEEKEGIE